MTRLLISTLALGLCLSVAANAQEEPGAVRPTHTPPPVVVDTSIDVRTNSRRPPSCWRAHPGSHCRVFFLTEFGIDMPVHSTRQAHQPATGPSDRDFPVRVTWTVGAMATIGRRHSTGLAVAITSEETNHFGSLNVVEWRYRNWVNSVSALDIGVGYKANGVRPPGTGLVDARGVTAMLGYTPTRWIGISARGDWVRARGQTHHGILLGLQSTRVSEHIFRVLAIGAVRALLAEIGIELEDDDEAP